MQLLKNKYFLLLVFSLPILAIGQTTLSPNDAQDSIRRREQMLKVDSLKYNMVATKPVAKSQEPKTDTIIRGNTYAYKNNWLNVGVGIGYTSANKGITSFPVGVGYNFRLKENVFKIGYHRSEVTVIFGQNNPDFMSDLHFCLGKRIENVKYNFAGFVGLARCVGLLDSSTKFTSPGIYAEIQATKKIFFDIGYGLTLYANYNKSYPIVGLRLDLFFSNSYRRKKFN